jgi:hypothetical protein
MDKRGRRTWIIVSLIALVLIGAFVAVILVDRSQQAASQPPEGVETFENLSRNHTQDPVSYDQTPPVGGDHNPVWQNQGFYSEPIRNENAVHDLEHGAVWIAYSPDLPQDQKDKLRDVVKSQDCLLASPYPDLPEDTPVVASAWGKQLKLGSANDPRLEQFISSFRKGPQTPEPNAPCIGGTGEPD